VRWAWDLLCVEKGRGRVRSSRLGRPPWSAVSTDKNTPYTNATHAPRDTQPAARAPNRPSWPPHTHAQHTSKNHTHQPQSSPTQKTNGRNALAINLFKLRRTPRTRPRRTQRDEHDVPPTGFQPCFQAVHVFEIDDFLFEFGGGGGGGGGGAHAPTVFAHAGEVVAGEELCEEFLTYGACPAEEEC